MSYACIRCQGSGVIFAYKKKISSGPWAFLCGCPAKAPLAIPSWDNYMHNQFIPEFDKESLKLHMIRVSRENLDRMTELFKQEDFKSEEFLKLVDSLGREYVTECYRDFKKMKDSLDNS